MPTKPKPHNARQQQANKQAYERKRGSARHRGYTHEWDEYSKGYLLLHPLCVYCQADGGRDEPATCVDHIKPANRFPELFWEPTNHAASCYSHNASKAANDRIIYGE